MGEGRDLRTQSSAADRFIIGSSALLLVLGGQALDLRVLAAKETLVMKLAGVKLLADSLKLYTESRVHMLVKLTLQLLHLGGGKAYASSRSVSTFSLRGFPLAAMTS